MLYKSLLHRNRCYNCDGWLYLLVKVVENKPNKHCTIECVGCGSQLGIALVELEEFKLVGTKEVNKVLYG